MKKIFTHLRLSLAIAIFCRFLLKTGRRFVYTYAAIISATLGLSLLAISWLLALNQVAALLSPLFGHWSDRWGYRKMMACGLFLASLSMLAVGILPGYQSLMIGLLVIGIGISICDPALYAYVGVKVPFAKRGKAIGMSELAWAASSLVGIPGAGILIQAYSWNTPFTVMGLLGLGGATLLHRLLPPDDPCHTAHPPRRGLPVYSNLVKAAPVRSMLIFALLVSCASDIFFVTYALWLAPSFKLGAVGLGLATVAIGIAELSGELLTATLADRLGLRRTVLVTLVATACCYALLPLLSSSLTGALVGIFLLCLTAEFNLVAAMSLCTEIQPTARAGMMSAFQAASGVGHVVGVMTGALIWWAGGVAAVAIVCALLYIVALVAVRFGLSHWQCPPPLPIVKASAQGTHSIHPDIIRCTPAQLPLFYPQLWN